MMVRTNKKIDGETYVWNDDGALALSVEDKNSTWKSNHGTLLNGETVWTKDNLSETYTMNTILCLIYMGIFRKLTSMMKNEKAAKLSELMTEIVKTINEVQIDMITDLTF